MNEIVSEEPWSPFRQFGLLCYEVMEIGQMLNSSSMWDELFEKQYYVKVTQDDRYRVFFDPTTSDETRRTRLRRLILLGVRLLTKADNAGVSREDMKERIDALSVDGLLLKVNHLRQMDAFVLTLVYPVEQVVLLTDDEVVESLRLVENIEQLIPASILFRILNQGIDNELVSALLEGSHG